MGIIQGSGLGPVCYIFNASDLYPINRSNKLYKYADDTYLLVPAKNTYLIPEEMDNITDWARAKNLKLNSAKCCEIIISLPTSDHTNLPNVHKPNHSWRYLGVTFTKTLSFEPHVHKVANKATTCLYALKTLKALWLTRCYPGHTSGTTPVR